jgi:hypothetical protein
MLLLNDDKILLCEVGLMAYIVEIPLNLILSVEMLRILNLLSFLFFFI